jgi:hypothetical protein
MHKKMTITLDEVVYEGLHRSVGKRKISQFIEDLVRPFVLGQNMESGYAAMSQDKEREAEALEWCRSFNKEETK